MEKQFSFSDVVWARARKPKSEIFWPAQVVDPYEKTLKKPKKKVIAIVRFLGENTYDNVKDSKDINQWDCKEKESFIQNGRASLINARKKICFNKGIKEANKIVEMQDQHVSEKQRIDNIKEKEKEVKSPRKQMSESVQFVDESEVKNKLHVSKDFQVNGSGSVRKPSISHKRLKNIDVNGADYTESEEPAHKYSRNQKSFSERRSLRKSPRTQLLKPNYSEHFFKPRSYVPYEEDVALSDSSVCGRPVQTEHLHDKANGTHERKTGQKSFCSESEESFEEKTKSHEIRSEENVPITQVAVNNGEGSEVMDTEALHEWDSDASSDSELMETALSPTQKDLKFNSGDIVWAKVYKDPYWPAQVERIEKKTRKFYVKFLGYNGKKCSPCKKLAPFACDADKREQFMNKAREYDNVVFNEAFTMAEDLVRRKALGIVNQDDKEVGAEDIKDEIKPSEDQEESTGERLTKEQEQPTCSVLRRSTRTKKHPSKYNNILTFIREYKPVLKKIYEGKRPCERNKIFKGGSAKEKSSLKHRSGFGPVSDCDIENDVMELLQEFYREIANDEQDFSTVSYISDVWLPEAIIYGIKKIDQVDRKTAETIFEKGSQDKKSQNDFTRLLKEKPLLDEDREACLDRAERAFSNIT